MTEKDSGQKPERKERQEDWMLKPCQWYKDEFKDCTCLRARFNQYFIFGEILDCSQWKVDYDNCKTWQSSDDDTAYNLLLESEKKRRLARLGPHYRNDTWTKRDKPPPDWNKPLPELLAQRQQGTFLEYKQKGLETNNINDLDMKLPLCTIL